MSGPKVYPNLLNAVVDGLRKIFDEGFFADQVVAYLLRRDKRWGARDRAFIATTLYDTVRWWRLLTFLAEAESPPFALAAYWWWKHGHPLDSQGFPKLNPKKLEKRLALAQNHRAIWQSVPDWLDKLGNHELGEAWEPTLHALNLEAPVFIRTNTLKLGRDELVKELQAEGIACRADERADTAIEMLERKNFWSLPQFKAGYFEVQDISSQQVAPALQVEPGMLVIDACAGAGGKTLHLAALMRNRGRLIALDVSEKKLDELKRRARRAGIDNLDIKLIESVKTLKRYQQKADRLLLDVPCSGLGVLRRNPDAKWKLQPGFVDEVRGWQKDILHNYTEVIRPGGACVYATCSILPSESESQVDDFLENRKDWSCLNESRISPLSGGDGFYWARLQRK